MTTLASAHALTTAPTQALFDRWADVDTWPEWNTDTEWVRLDGAFCQGGTGRLKPKGGPSVRFVITELEPGRVFTDVSKLIGARLTFRHVITAVDPATIRVDVTISLTGPLAPVWRLVMGKGLRDSLPKDLAGLLAVAQANAESA